MVESAESTHTELYLGRAVAKQLGCTVTTLAYLRPRVDVPIDLTHNAQ